MNLRRKLPSTSLNKNDRKVLDKYSNYYTNMIESNTARTDMPDADGTSMKLHD